MILQPSRDLQNVCNLKQLLCVCYEEVGMVLGQDSKEVEFYCHPGANGLLAFREIRESNVGE